MDNYTNEPRKQLYSRLFVRFIIAAAIFIGVLYALPYVFSLVAPFFFAFLLAAILNPLVHKLHIKFGWPRKLLALILVLLVVAMLLAVLGWLGYAVVNELVLLANNLDAIWETFLTALAFIGSITNTFLDFLPGDTEAFIGNFMDDAFEWLNTAIRDLGNYLIARTPDITTRLGSIMLDIIMFILAAYFLIVEYPLFKKTVEKYSNGSIFKYLQLLGNSAKVAFGGYFKAQLILSGITFVIIFSALLIMGQDYAFLLALLLALLDFLPLIGTSIVLLPWGIVLIITGNFWGGVILILLSWTCFFIRRIIEPKIMGVQTGLHPLVAILSIYVGLRAYGVWGAILGPVVVMIALNFVKTGVFDNTIKDIKDVFYDFRNILNRRA